MALVDVQAKTITLKVVYYGCAMGGKTTNLQTLHRLTDPEGDRRLVSIATQDDRTLFFDLLPVALGQIRGLAVRAKVYTVPGQIQYELTRRQVLAGADGVVLVVDSTQSIKDNRWALDNLRLNLRANGLDPDGIPLVLQWNKRDLAEALPVAELGKQLNAGGLPAHEAVATTGVGVVDTFSAVLRASLSQAYEKAGVQAPAEVLAEAVESALAEARAREPSAALAPPASAEVHTVDTNSYREEWAERGRDKRILDLEQLVSESVRTSMTFAERVDQLDDARQLNDRRARMMEALAKMAPALADPSGDALPGGVLKAALDGPGRSRGSLLLFRRDREVMDEREVLPHGSDLLNAAVAEGIGSAAHRLCRQGGARLIEDLASQVLFDATPPGTQSVQIVPLTCDGLRFGALLASGEISEPPIDEVESEYWQTVGTLFALSLHWHAMRRKLRTATAP